MTVMSTTAISLPTKSRFRQTTDGIVILFCIFRFDTGDRINVDATELLAAFPAPRTTTAGVKNEGLSS